MATEGRWSDGKSAKDRGIDRYGRVGRTTGETGNIRWIRHPAIEQVVETNNV